MRAATFSLFACFFVALLGRSASEPVNGLDLDKLPDRIYGGDFNRSGRDSYQIAYHMNTSITGLNNYISRRLEPISKTNNETTSTLFVEFFNVTVHFHFKCILDLGCKRPFPDTEDDQTITWDKVIVKANVTQTDDSVVVKIEDVELSGKRAKNYFQNDMINGIIASDYCIPEASEGLAKKIAQTVADRIAAKLPLNPPFSKELGTKWVDNSIYVNC